MNGRRGETVTEKPRILVVDDEQRSLDLLARALRKVGEVVPASSGDAAWDAFQQAEFDLVISDQRMPGTKGAELLARVAQRDDRIGRVLLTGYADMQATIDAINLGRVHAYVSKPWKPDQLALLAGSLIERTRLARQNDSLVKELSARNEELEIAMAELRRTHHRMASGVQLDAIGRTMAMVVHDLRGPLNTIGMATSQLAQSGDDPAGRAETARIASEEVQRLGQLCEELIEVSRAGSESLRYDDTPLDEVIRSVLTAMAEPCRAAGVAVEAELSCASSPRLDGGRMRRAILNLTQNALEAMRGGGTLRVESLCEGDVALVRVADTGPGIPDGIRETVFEPFVTHAKSGGLGLGLAIVRKIVEDHGGQVTLPEHTESGNAFEIRLPIAP
jgi:signal transduction histidine kinase